MVGGVPGVVLARATTHGHLGVARSRAARRAEGLDQIRPGLGGQQAITLFSCESRRFRTAGGDHYRRLDARSIVEPRVLDLEMGTGVGRKRSGQQALDDIDGFAKARMTLAYARPTRADDVFVQSLSRTKPKAEPIVAEQGQRRRALRHH